MNPTEPRVNAVLEAAMNQIRATAVTVATRLCETLGAQAGACLRAADRDALLELEQELRRNLGIFQRVFLEALREKVHQELTPRSEQRKPLQGADWQTLTLVEDREVEERMNFERIGQMISHECEWQLRDLAPYMGAVTGIGRADEDRNPLRGDVLGAALYRGIEAVSVQPASRRLLVRDLGHAMAHAMPECYADILRGLQQHGVQPVVLTVRTVDGPGNQLTGLNTSYATLPQDRAGNRGGSTDFGDSSGAAGGTDPMHGQRRGFVAGATRSGMSATHRGGGFAATGRHAGGATHEHSGSGRYGQHESTGDVGQGGGRPQGGAAASDEELMNLLRRLSAAASRSGELNALAREPGGQGAASHRPLLHGGEAATTRYDEPTGHGSSAYASGPATQGGGLHAAARTGMRGGEGMLAAAGPGAAHHDGLAGMMAVNLIRAHREELIQASSGKLDHMVIDVVGSLFDQILSDSRVPPQMARQIARLQLPVLRVALNDQTFFSTRRHPVRRFINRIASLACAFDNFDEGPGKQFLTRVAKLVQEIIEGDFDQIDIYGAKLAELERFIGEQSEGTADQAGAVTTLATKESELHIQQRYLQQLRTALAPLQLPAYLAEFLPQVWSQALVLATRRDGVDSDRARRFRRVGCDVVMSVQPKGSPMFRKKFLMQLPPLMKDLNEGMRLIGWPEAAQREFFGKLLPAHAESLKGPPLSELDHNLMVKRLEAIFAAPIPGIDAATLSEPLAEPVVAAIEARFTPEEAQQVGLVPESAVDWNGPPVAATPEPPLTQTASAEIAPGESQGPLDPPISQSGDVPEPSSGAQLIDHIKVGFAYQMHLKDEWQKVRLAHVSSGRSFFVFTRGEKHQETISMTSRMLARMCETGRMRAVESAYLMERATHRARQQLAALKAPSRH